MNRCGVRSHEAALELARFVSEQPHLSFDGIQAYAGQLSHEKDEAFRRAESARFEADLKVLKAFLEESGLPVKEVSGVSTGTVGFRTPDSVYTEWQIGSYLLMDGAYGQMNVGFENALGLLTTVLSVSGDQVITDGGMKELGMDQAPVYFRECPGAPIAFSEEHSQFDRAFLSARPGEKLLLIPGHGCTTVNIHDHLYLVSGDRVVDRIPVTSRGRGR